MPAIASSVLFGRTPPIGVAALRKRLRQSSLPTVAKAAISDPSVFSFAKVVFWVMLIGSSSTGPHAPVAGSTRLGTLPAAIRNPSGLPASVSPLRNRAFVNAEATVVSSLITTLLGGLLPKMASSAIAGLSPFGLLPLACPP